MLTMSPCVGPCLQLSMSPVLCGSVVHTSSSLMMVLLRGAAQAKASLVTAKTMQRQMGDLQSSPCREEVECHHLSSCTGAWTLDTKALRSVTFPEVMLCSKAKGTAQLSQDLLI